MSKGGTVSQNNVLLERKTGVLFCRLHGLKLVFSMVQVPVPEIKKNTRKLSAPRDNEKRLRLAVQHNEPTFEKVAGSHLFIVPYVAAGGNPVDSHKARSARGLRTFGQVLAGDLLREAGRVPQLLVLVLVGQSIVVVAQAGGNCRLSTIKLLRQCLERCKCYITKSH
jgi:hypothetical protein